MQILRAKGFCKILFEYGERYFGKTLSISGESGINKDFFIPKSKLHEMRWADLVNGKPSRLEWVDETIREEVLFYVIQEAEKAGYSFILC